MADVFISYRSEDRAVIEDIVVALQSEGLSVWWDRDIPVSENWRVEISRQLAAARCVLVVWSFNTIDLDTAKWVIQEAEDADQRGVLVPITIDDVLPPIGLRHAQAAELIDWRGNAEDPRWLAVLDAVNAKLSGETTALQGTQRPPPALEWLKGRFSLLLLALGLAVLVIASAVVAGPVVSAALVLGLSFTYAALNVLFSRRRGDRAASSFLQQVFAVSWVTYTVNVLVWLTAFAFALAPFASVHFFGDSMIQVVDELRQPLPAARVTIDVGGGAHRVDLNADGIGRFRYRLLAGPDRATLRVQHLQSSVEQKLTPTDRRFPDVVVPIWSGSQLFRVAHYTATELAVDAIFRGEFPDAITQRFPKIAAVLRNVVWDETGKLLQIFSRFDDPELDAWYYGEKVGGKPFGRFGLEENNGKTTERRFLRWPRSLYAETKKSYKRLETLLDTEPDGSLGRGVLAVVYPAEQYYRGRKARIDKDVSAHLLANSASATDEDGKLSVGLIQPFGASELRRLVQSGISFWGTYANEDEIFHYLRYLVSNNAPQEIILARIRILSEDEMMCGEVEGGFSIDMSLPSPELRVTIIENATSDNIPVSSIIYRMAERTGITGENTPVRTSQVRIDEPLPGGVLRPGEALIVPRKLILRSAETRQAVNHMRSLLKSTPESSDIAEIEFDPPLIFDHKTQKTLPIIPDPVRVRLPTAQIVRSDLIDNPAAANDREPNPDDLSVFLAGPSVEALDIVVNGASVPTREDKGVSLAMVGGQPWGSCPFVFVRHAGKNEHLNLGHVISDRIGAAAEGMDEVLLGQRVATVEIRELEPEVSFLNRALLKVRRPNGRVRIFVSTDPRLYEHDEHYAVLQQGETLRIFFADYSPREDDVSVTLSVTGYYVPLRASGRNISAITRGR